MLRRAGSRLCYATGKGALPKETISIVSGYTSETLERTVTVHYPGKHTMQDGTAQSNKWLLEFQPLSRWSNPLMGWSSSRDPVSNLYLEFNDEEEALAYCERHGFAYEYGPDTMKYAERKQPKTYDDNFIYIHSKKNKSHHENDLFN